MPKSLSGLFMKIKIALFEDDEDVAFLLQEMISNKNYEVEIFYNLSNDDWKKADLVLADFRNKLVSFAKIKTICFTQKIPLIAISGDHTTHLPQLIKPFSFEEFNTVAEQILTNLSIYKQSSAA